MPNILDTGGIQAALEANLRASFIATTEGTPSVYPMIYNEANANSYIERESVMAGVGEFSAYGEDEIPASDAATQAWTGAFQQVQYGLKTSVSRIALEDDMHGVIKSTLRDGGILATSANYTVERLAFAPFTNYFSSATSSAYAYAPGNGSYYPLIYTSHYRADGGTWQNCLSTPKDLSQETVKQDLSSWMVYQVDQRGLYTNVMPRTILGGIDDMHIGFQVTNTKGHEPFTQDWSVNPLDQYGLKFVTSRFFPNDGRYLLLGPKEQTGARMYWKTKPILEKIPESEVEAIRWRCRFRMVVGWLHTHNIWGST